MRKSRITRKIFNNNQSMHQFFNRLNAFLKFTQLLSDLHFICYVQLRLLLVGKHFSLSLAFSTHVPKCELISREIPSDLANYRRKNKSFSLHTMAKHSISANCTFATTKNAHFSLSFTLSYIAFFAVQFEFNLVL